MLRLFGKAAAAAFGSYMALSSVAPAATRADASGLSLDEARRRAASISDVRYDLTFSLSDADEDKAFSGTASVRFDVVDGASPLTLDFRDGDVTSLTVDGIKQASVTYNKRFLTLPVLKGGAHEVVVAFTRPYSTDGSGLYRFKDPEDGKVYVYSDLEPYDANAVFPCFDQPDLKATYTVKVEAPAAWTIVTSVREAQPAVVNGGRATWTFPESAKFSTYLFSLIGGPYQVWEGRAGDIPLRLFSRPSMGKFVPAEEWLKVTAQGFAFFNEYFGVAYPFKKYDQIVVPDFNAGAMENVAAVTFSERFIPRGETTNSEREDRANVILHEMAHMWFGNLVTMRWWNDLWLNESFATYMASLALTQATEFKRAWESFYVGTKQWAYWEDQLVTTHPIEGVVPDTEQAFANFDGITYGKGASSMKALSYYITADKFRDGVRRYFKKHAYANTELKDFMAALSEASGRDLGPWAEEWLRTAGLNTVEARFTCEDGKVKNFALNQTAPAEFPTLRSHRTQVAFFGKSSDGTLALETSVQVEYAGASTPVPSLNGKTCPHIVYPNYEDYDFVKVRLDKASLDAVKSDLALVPDALQRSMYWTSLWDSVRDGEWPVTAYADTALRQLPQEKDAKLLETVLGSVRGDRRDKSSVAFYLPPKAPETAKTLAAFESLASAQMEAAAAGSDAKRLWFDFYVRSVESAAGLARLERLLSGAETVAGLDLDQDRRWELVLQLAERGWPKAEALRQAETKRDPSSRGKQAALTAETLRPDAAVKAAWYAKVIDGKTKLSVAELKAAMVGMFPASQATASQAFATRYFGDLPRLAKTREREFVRRFASSLAPVYCEAAGAKALSDFAAKQATLPPVALKAVRVAAQEDGRCVRIRKQAEGMPRI